MYFSETNILVETLQQYGLPTAMHFDIQEAMQVMQKDKKKASAGMQYVVLQKMGKAVCETIPMKSLEKLINSGRIPTCVLLKFIFLFIVIYKLLFNYRVS